MECPFCGTINDDTADSCFKCGKGFSLTEGALLASRYEILSFLGRGGMGIVYRAHDRALDELVALKVLRFDLARSGDVARRFRSEIKLARKVRHPNVCGIHEYGEDGLYRFIVMELIEGWDLRYLLREQGAFGPEEACALAIEISEGLQAVHDVGIVHRDLKSPNIMLDIQGRVRLMDFGIAKQYGLNVTSGSATATGLVLGTPEYMSPEQARGQKIDFRSDVYALGVIGYELFTGRVPFKGETPLETIFKHLQEAPVFTGTQAAPGIPEPVIPVLRKALAKSPDDRFTTAGEMARALRQARAEVFGVSPSGRMPPVLTRTTTLEREKPEQTQTMPTPARSRSEVPTVRTPPAAIPGETAAPAPGARILPGTPTPLPSPTLPAAAPTRLVSVGGGLSQPALRGARRHGRSLWVAAAVLAVGVAGIVWLGAGRFRGPPETGPSTMPVVPAPIAGAATPAAEAQPTAVPTPSASQRGPGANSPPQRPRRSEPAARSDRGASAAVAAPRPAPTPPPEPPPAKVSPKPPVAAPAGPSIAPPDPPRVAVKGKLQLLVLPWAEVKVDGEAVGTTPMKPLGLQVGEHEVLLSHPSYKPLQKRVVIRADETTTLEVDLGYEAFPVN